MATTIDSPEGSKRRRTRTKENIIRDMTAILTPGMLAWDERRRIMEMLITFHYGKSHTELEAVGKALFPSQGMTAKGFYELINNRVYEGKRTAPKVTKYSEDSNEFRLFELFHQKYPKSKKGSLRNDWNLVKAKLGDENLLADLQQIYDCFLEQMTIREKIKAIQEAYPMKKIFFPEMKHLERYIKYADWYKDYSDDYKSILSSVGLKDGQFVLREDLGLPEAVPGRGMDVTHFLRIQLSSAPERELGSKGFYRADDGHYYNAKGLRGQ